MERDEAHAKELEKHKKEHEKELSNFHKIYAAKMKRQEKKYTVEILKLIETMKEIKDNKEFYKTSLEKERETIQSSRRSLWKA